MMQAILSLSVRIIVLLSLCLIACTCRSAPAPLPKAKKPTTREAFVGKWAAKWNDFDCTVLLSRDGFYACQWTTNVYVGSWTYSDGKLAISERLFTSDAPTADIKATFHIEHVPGKGRDQSGGTLELIGPSNKPIAPGVIQ